MRVERRDVGIGRRRDVLLRLGQFEIARHARGEAIARLLQLLTRELRVRPRGLDLLIGGVQVEERRADFVLNPSLQFRELGLALPERRLRLDAPRDGTAAVEHRHAHRRRDRVGVVRAGD